MDRASRDTKAMVPDSSTPMAPEGTISRLESDLL